MRVSAAARCARSNTGARRSGVWRGRSATAVSTAAAGGRRSSAPRSSTDAGSAQWKSSSTSTSGLVSASCSSSAHRAVAAVALVLQGHVAQGCEPGQRREDVRELRLDVVAEGRELLRVEGLDELVQPIDEDVERQLALELRGRSRENEVSAQLQSERRALRAAASCRSLARPPARSHAAGLDRARRGPARAGELMGTPDEVLGTQVHLRPSRPADAGPLIENQGARSGCRPMSQQPGSAKLALAIRENGEDKTMRSVRATGREAGRRCSR